MEERECSENRLVYSIDIPTLEEIASHQVALSIRHSHFFRLKNDDNLNDNNYESLVETLNMPKMIEKVIKIALIRIEREIREWSFELDRLYVKLNNPNWCVWSINGKIDLEKSALKTLSVADGELSEVQKFAIMCEYCLEDEIVKFPIDSLPANFLERSNPRGDLLVEYWYYYAKNDPRRTPTYLDVVMSLLKCYFHKWIPFQYFWHRMSTDWRMTVAESVFEHFNADDMDIYENPWLYRTYHMEKIFMLLSRKLQCNLLSTRLVDVILNLITSEDSSKSVRWIWTHYKSFITVGDFVKIIIFLIIFRSEIEWMNWLIDIWDSVSDQFKIAAAERVTNLMFDSYFNFHSKPSPSAFTFLCRILSLQHMNFRKELILKHAENLGTCIVDHQSMNQILMLCLSEEDELSYFKKMVIESGKMKDTCMMLLRNSNLDHLNMMLDFFCSTQNEIRKFKKELLKSDLFSTEFFLFHLSKWHVLKEFINEIYPENDSMASRTRKQLITSWNTDFLDHRFVGSNDIRVDHLIKIVESEFDIVEVDTLKRVWIRSVCLMLKTRNSSWLGHFFSTTGPYCFIKWCIGDGDRSIPEYECEALLDTIFDGAFRFLNEEYTENHELPFDETYLFGLDRYLKLILMSDENVADYKSSKMISSKVQNFFEYVSSRNDESSLQKLENYFGIQTI